MARPHGLRQIVLIAVTALALGELPASAATTWTVVPTPNRGSDLNDLAAVTATAANDAWAAGWFRNANLQYRTLIEHFDGSAWQVSRSRNVGTSTNLLHGVDAVSVSDAWAVGEYSSSAARTLVEHWNGSRWSVVSSPNVGTSDNALLGVAALSADDAWAVGYTRTAQFAPLVQHWNGTAWSVVMAPDPVGGGLLRGVAVVSATDVWAVGVIGGDDAALAEHWDGHVWSIVQTPNLVAEESLNSVAAITSNDVWGVGQKGSQTLTEHWNGSAWSVIPSPNPLASNGRNSLRGVVALSPTDVWAVGTSLDFLQGELEQTITERWKGSAWRVVASPDKGTGSNALNGVAAVTATSLFAAGSYQTSIGNVVRTLVLRAAHA